MDPITLSKIDSAQKALEGRIAALETGAVALQSDVTTLKETSATKDSVEAVQSVVDATRSEAQAIKESMQISPKKLKFRTQEMYSGTTDAVTLSVSGAGAIYEVDISNSSSKYKSDRVEITIDGTVISGRIDKGTSCGFRYVGTDQYYEYHSSSTGSGYITYPLINNANDLLTYANTKSSTYSGLVVLTRDRLAFPIYYSSGFSIELPANSTIDKMLTAKVTYATV